MKNNTTVAFMAIIAIGSGLVGYTFATDNSVQESATAFVVKPAMSGYLQVEVHDSQGNLKDVRHADNVVTKQGENCALRLLFQDPDLSGASSTSGNCAGAMSQPFTYIGVGTGASQESGDQVKLDTELAADGLTRAAATTVTWTNSSGAEPGDSAQIVLAKTFTVTGTQIIAEAGLFNDTSGNGDTDAMFARKAFNGVTVNNGDSLTVTWTINIGNTTNFD